MMDLKNRKKILKVVYYSFILPLENPEIHKGRYSSAKKCHSLDETDLLLFLCLSHMSLCKLYSLLGTSPKKCYILSYLARRARFRGHCSRSQSSAWSHRPACICILSEHRARSTASQQSCSFDCSFHTSDNVSHFISTEFHPTEVVSGYYIQSPRLLVPSSSGSGVSRGRQGWGSRGSTRRGTEWSIQD